MNKKVSLVVGVFAMVFTHASIANDNNCVMRYSVNSESVSISQRGPIESAMVIVDPKKNIKKCVVSFRSKVNNTWHIARGESVWDGNSKFEHACDQAVKNAEKDLVETIAPATIRTQSTMVCSDAPNLQEKAVTIGATGSYSQFRRHPEKTGVFWYNGTHCKWTVNTKFDASNLRTHEAIICQTSSDVWTVIDVF